MTAFDASSWIGTRNVRVTDAQLALLDQWDAGLGAIGVSTLWRHTGLFILPLTIQTAINANAKNSLEYTAPIPFKVVAIDVGCESAAGSAMVADIEKNPSGSPDTFATMTTGAVDIKTAAGDFVDLPVLDGAEDVAAGDQIRLVGTATGSGAVVGCTSLLVCYRL